MINYKSICINLLFFWTGGDMSHERSTWLVDLCKGSVSPRIYGVITIAPCGTPVLPRFHRARDLAFFCCVALGYLVYSLLYARYRGRFMVILPSHIARNFQDSFSTNQHIGNVRRGPGFVAIAQMHRHMCQEMVSPILGALLPPPMELDDDDDILPPQAKRPPETSIWYQFDPVFKDVSERSTLFEFGTWVEVTYSKYHDVLQISHGFISMPKKTIWHSIAFLVLNSSFFENFNQPYEAIDTDNFISRRLASQSYAPRPRESRRRPENHKWFYGYV